MNHEEPLKQCTQQAHQKPELTLPRLAGLMPNKVNKKTDSLYGIGL